MYQINYLAVVVATLICMVIGSLWYSPLLFANRWMKELGFGKKDEDRMKKEAPKAMLGMLVGAFLMSWILAYSVYDVTDFVAGMIRAFWMWLGFVVPVYLSMTLFESRKWTLFFISTGYYLVSLLIIGGVLAVWK